MKPTSILAALLICTVIALFSQSALAGEPQRCPYCGQVHGSQSGRGYHQGGYGTSGYGTSGYGASGYGLPQGRRYYNGRYFGNLNNRFYGPQYGYF